MALLLVLGGWAVVATRRLDARIAAMQRDDERIERLIRDEMAQNREEAAAANSAKMMSFSRLYCRWRCSGVSREAIPTSTFVP